MAGVCPHCEREIDHLNKIVSISDHYITQVIDGKIEDTFSYHGDEVTVHYECPHCYDTIIDSDDFYGIIDFLTEGGKTDATE